MKKIAIIYENDEILVIDKPAGLAVQGGAGVAHSLDEELSRQQGYKIHLVHRLDKETFGLMVVAKNPVAASKWISLIAGKQVRKEYRALCFGLPTDGKKTLMEGVAMSPVVKGERGLPAETRFKVEKTVFAELPKSAAPEAVGAGSVSCGGEKSEKKACESSERIQLSLLHLVLGTGRMHQIRIHLARYGCPIAGDDRHGDFKLNKKARKIGIKSLQLCSFRLTIPCDGKKKVFETALPDSMIKYFEDNSEHNEKI